MNEEHNLNRYRPFRGSESHHTVLYRVRRTQSASVSDVENLVEDYQDIVEEMEEQAIKDTKYFVGRANDLEEENKKLQAKVEELESCVKQAYQEVDQFHQEIVDALPTEEELSKFLLVWRALRCIALLIEWVKEERSRKEYFLRLEQVTERKARTRRSKR